MVAGSLSKVTTRGVEVTCASKEAFKKEITAFAPSALRNPVPNPNPLPAVFPMIPGAASTPLDKPPKPGVKPVVWLTPLTVVVVPGVGAVGGSKYVVLLPNETFCAASVPVQSIPFLLIGLLEISPVLFQSKPAWSACPNELTNASHGNLLGIRGHHDQLTGTRIRKHPLRLSVNVA